MTMTKQWKSYRQAALPCQSFLIFTLGVLALFPLLSRATDYWATESAKEREELPLYEAIPAAAPSQLTVAKDPGNKEFQVWHRSQGDDGGRRYSVLAGINRQNVTNLEVAWIYRSRDGSNSIECNPIIVDNVMYAPTPGNHMVAVNAETGRELWRFSPEGLPAFRGLIYWPGNFIAGERILFCSGHFLYALDPKTGRPVTGFGDHGKVLLPGEVVENYGAATAGPTIFKHILVVPGFQKDVWGFDIVTGKHLWTFHTVPHPGEFGYDTWDKTVSYGANCWAGMAMDDVRGIAYITTGSPKPNFVGVGHRGQNLFANCLVALDARNGKLLWYFQEIRHDIWDLDISAPPNLTTITLNGRRVDAVDAVTKIGNTILLDRVTGKPIFPFRLRRAPTSEIPGEQTWPYQPDLELPEPFAKWEFTTNDLTDRTEDEADYALTHFKSMRTGWFLPLAVGRPTLYFNVDGGAEWTGACVDPNKGRLYVSANHVGWAISLFRDDDPPDDPQAPKTPGQIIFEKNCAACHGNDRKGLAVNPPLRGLQYWLTDDAVIKQIRLGKNAMPPFPQLSDADVKSLVDFLMNRDRPLPAPATKSERPTYGFGGWHKFLDAEGYPANKPPWGTLDCLDLNTGKILWKVPLGDYPALVAQGFKNYGAQNYGGPILTAGGLVFVSGTPDNEIHAFNSDTGEKLWAGKLPFAGSGTPSTYEVNGRQYIVIAATGNRRLDAQLGDAYVAFALPKTNDRQNQ
jgi:quinoprotein glucose dehydrogenase